MAVNKVVINDKIALDLTGDTVTPSDLVEGVTAHDATGMQITGTRPATGGTDTSDATATAGDIAKGKTAYVQGKRSPEQLIQSRRNSIPWKMLACHTMGLTSCTAKNSNIQLSTKKGLL